MMRRVPMCALAYRRMASSAPSSGSSGARSPVPGPSHAATKVDDFTEEGPGDLYWVRLFIGARAVASTLSYVCFFACFALTSRRSRLAAQECRANDIRSTAD